MYILPAKFYREYLGKITLIMRLQTLINSVFWKKMANSKMDFNSKLGDNK